jgi:phage tail tube protein FII
MSNLRDSNIFQDFTVWIQDVGKIGEAPEFQPPEINIAVEEFRGGGMDGTV